MPQLKQEEKQFGDLKVHTRQLRPRVAYKLAALAAENPGSDELLEGALASTYAVAADGPKGEFLKYDFSNVDKIDEAFSGRFSQLAKVLQWVLEVNFGNFTDGSAPPAPKADPATDA